MIICRACAVGKNYPRPPVRVGGQNPCQFCSGIDPYGNYMLEDILLPDNPMERNNVVEREKQNSGTL